MHHQGASTVPRGNFQTQKLCRVTVPVKSARKESGVLELVYRKKVTASIVGQANMVVPQKEPLQKIPARNVQRDGLVQLWAHLILNHRV